eukprot:scaffold33939_cov112-Isochrysis_galbana.AAC.1
MLLEASRRDSDPTCGGALQVNAGGGRGYEFTQVVYRWSREHGDEAGGGGTLPARAPSHPSVSWPVRKAHSADPGTCCAGGGEAAFRTDSAFRKNKGPAAAHPGGRL